MDQETLDRFWEKVDVRGPDDCWEWLAYRGGGYGRFQFEGRAWLSHRISWTITNGPVLEGLLICHRCDNPGCVNPAHLFMGTNKDNTQDALSKGRVKVPGLKGENHGRSRLTEEKVLAIRERYKYRGKENQYTLARKYNVCQNAIHNIVTRKTWQHI